MEILKFSSEFFNAKDTLSCGQVFRYTYSDGVYTLISKNKCCNLYTQGDYTYIETDDVEYFYNYFDLELSIKVAIGGVIGGILGAKLAQKISKNFLKVIKKKLEKRF